MCVTSNVLKKGLATCFASAAIMWSGASNAAIIFQDDFNRANANALGNGWSEIEENASGVEINSNTMRLRGLSAGAVDAQAAQLTISTIGLGTITLEFDWAALVQSEAVDTLVVEWRAAAAGAAWTTLTGISLFNTGLGDDTGVFTHKSVSLSPGADNLSNIQFRFRIDADTLCCTGASASRQDEGARIDNVVLQGSPALAALEVAAAPEPTSIAILGLGLAGLGLLRRRES